MRGTKFCLAALVIVVLSTLWTYPAAAACHVASFSSSSYEVAENAASVKIVVNRKPTGCSGTLEYSTSDGTAKAGADYQSTSGEMQFDSDDDQKTFEVNMRDDTAAEGNETFSVSLRTVSGGITTFSNNPATVTIVENDAAPPPPAPPPPPPPRASPARAASPSPPPPPSPTPSPSPTESPTPSPSPTARAAADDGGGPPLGVIIAIVAFVLAGGAGVALWYLRRTPA